jgi:hypothetical protein
LIAPRPKSLHEVARRAADGGSFEYELADFLHEFALRGNIDMLTESPPLLRARGDKAEIHDAYLAAVAASLAVKLGCPVPPWMRQPERILREPWFALPGRHMRALLLVESPAAFRERSLFVSANALCVA